MFQRAEAHLRPQRLQKHLGITFFRGTELREMTKLFTGGEANTSIQSIRVTKRDPLDAQAFRRLLHAAVALDADESAKPPPPKQRDEWPMPSVLAKALKKNKKAAAFFESLKPTYQREYKVWISTAKRDPVGTEGRTLSLRPRKNQEREKNPPGSFRPPTSPANPAPPTS